MGLSNDQLVWLVPLLSGIVSVALAVAYGAGRSREAAKWNRSAIAAMHRRTDVLERIIEHLPGYHKALRDAESFTSGEDTPT